MKFVEDLKIEQDRPNLEALSEEELEMFDLLVKEIKLTETDKQKVKLAVRNLFTLLTTKREDLLVIDWFKDEKTKLKVKSAIEISLNRDLPECYDKNIFNPKVNLLLSHFIDMAVQAYGWIGHKAR